MSKKQLLFVCLGNICRSPAAAGIMQHLIQQKKLDNAFHVQSCGVGDWHIGQSPDERMVEAAKKRGIILKNRAKQFKISHFEDFDFILTSCNEVKGHLKRLTSNPVHHQKLVLMTHFSRIHPQTEVPDPYYGSSQDFDLVLDILEESCLSLLDFFDK